jgi:K+-sensing histidine kinase KdpD
MLLGLGVSTMKRREFITLIGAAATGRPLRGDQMLKPFVSRGPMRVKSLRDFTLPVVLSLALIVLTSWVLAEVHSQLRSLDVWRDPEDLALAYLLPTIFIAVFFGSTIAITTSLASGLAAAYFIYPPQFSFLIDDSHHIAELGFIVVLGVTASKAVAVITDDDPLVARRLLRLLLRRFRI